MLKNTSNPKTTGGDKHWDKNLDNGKRVLAYAYQRGNIYINEDDYVWKGEGHQGFYFIIVSGHLSLIGSRIQNEMINDKVE